MLLFLDGFASTSSAGFLSISCLCKLKHFQDCHNSTWLYRWASLHAWNRVSFNYCYYHHHHHHHASSGRFLSGGTKYFEKWTVVHYEFMIHVMHFNLLLLFFFFFFFGCVDNLMIAMWIRNSIWTFDVSIGNTEKCHSWVRKLLAFVYCLLMWL